MMPLGLMPDAMMRGLASGVAPNRVESLLHTASRAGIGGGMRSNARPGLFGGLANMARGVGNRFMLINPDTRLMMGAGLMQGGLPGLAQGYLSGRQMEQGQQDRAFQMDERAFQQAERDRAAAERAQRAAALEAFISGLPEDQRAAARLDPGAAIGAEFREPARPTRVQMPGIGLVEVDPADPSGYRVIVPEAPAVTAARAPRGGGATAKPPADEPGPGRGFVIRGR